MYTLHSFKKSMPLLRNNWRTEDILEDLEGKKNRPLQNHNKQNFIVICINTDREYKRNRSKHNHFKNIWMVKRADKEQELLIMPTFHLSQIKVKLQTRYFYYYKTHWLSDYFPTIHAGTVAPNLTKLKTRTLSLTFIQKHFLTSKERNKNSLVYQVWLSRW